MPVAFKVVGDELQSIYSKGPPVRYRVGEEIENAGGLFAHRAIEDAVKRWSRTRRRNPERVPRIIRLEYDAADVKPWPRPQPTILIFRCTVADEIPVDEVASMAVR